MAADRVVTATLAFLGTPRTWPHRAQARARTLQWSTRSCSAVPLQDPPPSLRRSQRTMPTRCAVGASCTRQVGGRRRASRHTTGRQPCRPLRLQPWRSAAATSRPLGFGSVVGLARAVDLSPYPTLDRTLGYV